VNPGHPGTVAGHEGGRKSPSPEAVRDAAAPVDAAPHQRACPILRAAINASSNRVENEHRAGNPRGRSETGWTSR
jgi:hypothetical protein